MKKFKLFYPNIQILFLIVSQLFVLQMVWGTEKGSKGYLIKPDWSGSQVPDTANTPGIYRDL